MKWPRGIASTIAAIVAIGCGSAAPVQPRPGTLAARDRRVPAATPASCGEVAADGRVCVLANFDASTGIVEVTLRIDPSALPAGRERVSLVFRPELAADALTAIDPARWPTSLGAVNDAVELRYRVSLPERGGAIRRPAGWHLTGMSFLPDLHVDGTPVAAPATLLLDVGDEPLWTAAGGQRRLFDAPSLARLADESYEVGAVRTELRQVGGTELVVASSDAEEPLAPTAQLVEQALRKLSERLGPPPASSILFAFHRVDDAATESVQRGSSIVLVDAHRGPLTPYDERTASAVRSLVRLWNPEARAPHDAWLARGVTEYLAATVVADLVDAPPDAFARVLLRAHARYAASAEGRALRGGDDDPAKAFATNGGMVAGFCLDQHLREGSSSLAAVLRTTLTRGRDEIDTAALLEDLAAVSGSSASYLEALLSASGAFAIDECLARFGFSAHETSYRGLTDAAIAELLAITELRSFALAPAFEVIQASEPSELNTGDIVREVRGRRVAELADIAFALRDANAGERFVVRVRRGTEEREIELVVPRPDADDREERVYRELTPSR